MRIMYIYLMLLWCLLGIFQIWVHSPFDIFLDIVMILSLIYYFGKSQALVDRLFERKGFKK